MASHAVVGDSPFMKRVLIPFWVIRILVMLLDIAIYALAIGVIAAYSDDVEDQLEEHYNARTSITAAIAVLVVVMLIIVACLILDIVCIVKRARRTLSPRFFLITNVVQTTIWTILFILSMIGARTGLTVAIAVIIYLSFVGVLIYASVIFHRHRKGTLRGAYVQANNPSEQFNLAQHAAYPAATTYAAETGYPSTTGYPQNTGYPYAPQTYGVQPGAQAPQYYDPQAVKPQQWHA